MCVVQYIGNRKTAWGYGSVGRAMRSQCIGQGFESPYLHHIQDLAYVPGLFFCIAHASLRSLIRDLHGKYAEGRHFVPCTQCIGQGFESPYLHHLEPRSNPWFLFICINGVAGIIVKTKKYEKIISYDWLTKPRENGKFVKKK